jgi:hypothetical protein
MKKDDLMLFDPATGEEKPYPSHAEQWRKYHGECAWLFNPWTGVRRDARDVGSDPFGLLYSYDEPTKSAARGSKLVELRPSAFILTNDLTYLKRDGALSVPAYAKPFVRREGELLDPVFTMEEIMRVLGIVERKNEAGRTRSTVECKC